MINSNGETGKHFRNILWYAYTRGGRRGSNSPALFHGRQEGARISFHTELFPFLLSCEGGFSGIVDSLVQENFSGGKPQTPIHGTTMRPIY